MALNTTESTSQNTDSNANPKYVLILCMSTLNNLTLNYYQYQENYYSCVSQLEAGTKTLIDMLASSDPEAPTDLKIIVLNTERTLEESRTINENSYSAYSFYKERCKQFVAGNDKDNKLFSIEENRIEKHLKDRVENWVLTTVDSLNDKNEEINEQMRIQKIEAELKQFDKDLDSSIESSFELTSEEKLKIPEQLKELHEAHFHAEDTSSETSDTDTTSVSETSDIDTSAISETTDSSAIPEPDIFPEGFDMRNWIREAQQAVQNDTNYHLNLSVVEKQINKLKTEEKDLTFHMILDYQQRIREMKVLQQLHLAKLIDIWDENKKYINRAAAWNTAAATITEANKNIELLQLQEELNRSIEENTALSNIIYKLNKHLQTIENNYVDLVHRYTRQCLWNLLEKENPAKRNVRLHFESIEIQDNAEEKLNQLRDLVIDDPVPQNVHVYIDTQGGLRDNIVTLTAIMQLLSMEKVNIEETFATRYGVHNFINQVYTNKQKYQIYDLVTAMYDVEDFLRTDKLSIYFHNKKKAVHDLLSSENEDRTYNELVNRISTFFNKDVKRNAVQLNLLTSDLSLCQMNDFSEHIDNVNKECLALIRDTNACLGSLSDTTENPRDYRLKSELLQLAYYCLNIVSKGLSGCVETFADKIRWCLDHGYVQPALTLCAELSATEFIVPKRIVAFPESLLIEESGSEDNTSISNPDDVVPIQTLFRNHSSFFNNDLLKSTPSANVRKKRLSLFVCNYMAKECISHSFTQMIFSNTPVQNIYVKYFVYDNQNNPCKKIIFSSRNQYRGANECKNFSYIKNASKQKLETLLDRGPLDENAFPPQLHFISHPLFAGIWDIDPQDNAQKKKCQKAYDIALEYGKLKNLRNSINHADVTTLSLPDVIYKIRNYCKMLDDFEKLSNGIDD